jgi:hypothetical protein
MAFLRSKLPLLLLITAQFFLGCQKGSNSETSESAALFRQSKRFDPKPEDLKEFVSLGGAAAFPLKNSKNLPIFMSGRHVVGEDAEKWCAHPNPKDVLTTNSGVRLAKCKKIIAAREHIDPFVFLIEGEQIPELTPLSLAGFLPSSKTPLQLLGFPADTFRKRKPTVTDNCWVLNPAYGTQQDMYQKLRAAYPTAPQFSESETQKKDVSERFTHNCSVYGGNSGGPMLLKDTSIVLGIPIEYIEQKDIKEGLIDEESERVSSDTMEFFVKTFPFELKEYGIEVIDRPPDPKNAVVTGMASEIARGISANNVNSSSAVAQKGQLGCLAILGQGEFKVKTGTQTIGSSDARTVVYVHKNKLNAATGVRDLELTIKSVGASNCLSGLVELDQKSSLMLPNKEEKELCNAQCEVLK